MKRCSGILLPIPVLPNNYGIGNIGKQSAQKVSRFMNESGQTVLNILPINEMGKGNCPYQSIADEIAFILIDPEGLVDCNLVTWNEVKEVYSDCDNGTSIDYGMVREKIEKILRIAFARISRWTEYERFKEFVKVNPKIEWYGIFQALRDVYGPILSEWPEKIRFREQNAIDEFRSQKSNEIQYWEFIAFVGHEQYKEFKQILNQQGILIYGDLPFYYDLNSMAVWLHPEAFEVDPIKLTMRYESGAAPDYFAPEGQRWGTPCYHEWVENKLNPALINLWETRIKGEREKYDILRLDHFRGLDSPYKWDFETGKGSYQRGAGYQLVEIIKDNAGKMQVIAEDLGDLSYGHTRELLAKSGLYGMKVSAFGFFDPNGEHWPSNWTEQFVGYTGTHDNEAVRKIWDNLRYDSRKQIFGDVEADEACWRLIEEVLESRATLSIISFVDLFNTPRYNIPGIPNGNWSVRLAPNSFDHEANRLNILTKKAGR